MPPGSMPSRRRHAAPAQRRKRAAQAANPRPAAPAIPDLPSLPTLEEIAAADRRRPIGAVIADICRDLCIMPSDPLWRDVHSVIIYNNGNLARLVNDIFDRTLGPLPSARSPVLPSPAPSGTGPP